ncbi:MAG: methyltransferase domain-containing protein [Candidatus Heimdallarchaeota archaeon]|nr:methyltransferase domain-containing protein [Candidatus Heimdallarchaeota archaeon]
MTEKAVKRASSCCSGNTTSEVQITDSEEKARKTIRGQYSSIAGEKTQEMLEEKNELVSNKKKSPFYSEEELRNIPENANLGLGSGNPIALADVQEGETIVDLGSGAGIDCFLAANRAGIEGKVIGVDMTPEMIDLARENAFKGNYKNVEFRLGEIEHLPIANNVADLIISNCVINLASDKEQVFREAYRVLKPGGRIIISDIMFAKTLPEKVSTALKGMASCVSRAVIAEEYLETIKRAGFTDVEIIDRYTIQRKEQKLTKKEQNEKQKITLISDGKKIEVELTPEEIENMNEAIISAHVRAMKPN